MIRSFLSFSLRFFKSRLQLQLEIIFLRKQLEIAARTSPKLRIRHFDRLFFSVVTNPFGEWKNTLLILKPETVAAAMIARADAIVSWNFSQIVRQIVRLDKMRAYNMINLMHGYGILTIISQKEVRYDDPATE